MVLMIMNAILATMRLILAVFDKKNELSHLMWAMVHINALILLGIGG